VEGTAIPIASSGALEGLSPELARDLALAPQGWSGLPGGLTHSDLRLVTDLADLARRAGPEGLGAPPELEVLTLALLLARDEGSLCIALAEESLTRRLGGLFGAEAGDLARGWALRALAWVRHDEESRSLLGSPQLDSFPLIRYERDGREYLYFQRYFVHERDLMARLGERGLAGAGALGERPDSLVAALREVLLERPERSADGVPRVLNASQALAVALSLLRGLVIVSGGPGTGKTSIVSALVRCLARLGCPPEEIRLTAPTGRAAQRLAGALRRGLCSIEAPTDADRSLEHPEGTTLHRLLGYNPRTGGFRHHAGNPLAARVVIVDECSMVDVELMRRLLEALEPGTRLVLLGDRDQLPSVDAGAVLASLLPRGGEESFLPETAAELARLLTSASLPTPEPRVADGASADSVVTLRENYRSQREIQEVAGWVRQAIDPDALIERLPVLPAEALGQALASSRGGCLWIAADGAGVREWERALGVWADAQYGSAYAESVRAASGLALGDPASLGTDDRARLLDLLRAVEDARVLTLVREGPHGCAGVNGYLCSRLAHGLDPSGGPRAFSGMPVLVTHNDPSTQLWNGDVGVLLRDHARRPYAVFAREADVRAVRLASLPPWEPAFAITVHKSQGSEYGTVLVAVPPEGAQRLLSREMLYTAITRARTLALIHSCRAPLALALASRFERESGMAWGEAPGPLPRTPQGGEPS
jgi:exodeoxyribonuclease V alpha subunit